MKRHLHASGVFTYCGIVRLREETEEKEFFSAKEEEQCKICIARLEKKGYSYAALQFRFSQNATTTH